MQTGQTRLANNSRFSEPFTLNVIQAAWHVLHAQMVVLDGASSHASCCMTCVFRLCSLSQPSLIVLYPDTPVDMRIYIVTTQQQDPSGCAQPHPRLSCSPVLVHPTRASCYTLTALTQHHPARIGERTTTGLCTWTTHTRLAQLVALVEA